MLARHLDARGEARLAAYCSAKGRMQASALVLRPSDEQVWLVTDAGIQPGWLKRLKMFVLRSAVALHLADDVELAGVIDATHEIHTHSMRHRYIHHEQLAFSPSTGAGDSAPT